MCRRLHLAALSAALLAASSALADGRLGVAYLQEARVRSDLGAASLTPGMQVSYDLPLLGALGNELLVAASVAGYRPGAQQLHLLNDALLGYRFTLPVGLFLDARVGASYLHVFEDAGTLARGGVEAVRSRRFAACGALGVGWDFEALSPLPFSLYARVTGYDRRVGGSAQLPQLTTQAGFALHFG
ncbi:MAG TPA: hypothetical protein VFO83_01455 [Aggregicoccus sp.]|nr:hypothetical protein [Aggregicoccus sp.]